MESKKSNLLSVSTTSKKATLKSKPKSLRPMRSMVAIRSLKSRTQVASLQVRKEGSEEAKI